MNGVFLVRDDAITKVPLVRNGSQAFVVELHRWVSELLRFGAVKEVSLRFGNESYGGFARGNATARVDNRYRIISVREVGIPAGWGERLIVDRG